MDNVVTRPGSAAVLRRGTPDRRRRAPRPGTRLRAVYDLLLANPGRPVRFDWRELGYPDVRRTSRTKEDLVDYYNLDVRCLKGNAGTPGHRDERACVWLLVGEWVGRGGYLDYVADPALAGPPR